MVLLQFKPTPMYILNKIDTTLDLLHMQHIGTLFCTQHISTLFCTWFHGAQFIIVSLKEGLFTNVNILFCTRFCDGTSIVERMAQCSISSLYNHAEHEREEDSAG